MTTSPKVRPPIERVGGLHFFNPVPVLSLVEIIPSLLTEAEVTERAPLPQRLVAAGLLRRKSGRGLYSYA